MNTFEWMKCKTIFIASDRMPRDYMEIIEYENEADDNGVLDRHFAIRHKPAVNEKGKQRMIEQTIKFHSMQETPEKSGYILLAIRHNNLNDVVMGHWSHLRGFQCSTYPAQANTVYCYWAYMPEHPDGEKWKE